MLKTQRPLRRSFHHFLISRRKERALPKKVIHINRQKRTVRYASHPIWLAARKVFFYITITAILFGSFYVVLFSSFFTITKITVDKSGDAIAGTALAPFLEKWKGKNILFLDTNFINRELEQSFKNEILLVSVKKLYPNHLKVKVEEYPPVLTLIVQVRDTTQRFVLNQIGYPIAQGQKNKELPVLFLKRSEPLSSKKTILIEKDKLAPILLAFSKFTELFGMKIISGEWKKTERELHLTTEKGFSLWLDLTMPIESQFTKLKRSLAKLDIYREKLEYIDLRIPGGENEKVIYKRRK